ncbi:pinensin family lanthipeptide [Fulvivirga imtechensis]|uniref:pinensin family lanthipeptide n=1 Tax=Fulvivirga imtechensis TaxID=881893 RepID=UPI0002E3E297|nr:pinensin family lanthipeptide [Fulvivirga imtechensis]
MKKFKINEIKVKSFVTALNAHVSETVKVQGGATQILCTPPQSAGPGILTHCCADTAYRCES